MVCFVVLNYNNYDDTEKCIDSLLLLKGDTKTVLVDNASADGSYEKLYEKYRVADKVDFIKNEANFGFSKGNNIGCAYAKQQYQPDFLCVINNDTYIEDTDFCAKLEQAYAKTPFDILGPCIWNTRKNYNQNPFHCPANAEEVELEIKGNIKSAKYLKFGAIPYYLASRFQKSHNTGITVNGAACIFSKTYLNRYEEVFLEKTFMYGEEAILYQRALHDNLKIEFDNDLVIYHSDSGTTRKSYRSKLKKWKFQNQMIRKASYALLDYVTGLNK